MIELAFANVRPSPKEQRPSNANDQEMLFTEDEAGQRFEAEYSETDTSRADEPEKAYETQNHASELDSAEKSRAETVESPNAEVAEGTKSSGSDAEFAETDAQMVPNSQKSDANAEYEMSELRSGSRGSAPAEGEISDRQGSNQSLGSIGASSSNAEQRQSPEIDNGLADRRGRGASSGVRGEIDTADAALEGKTTNGTLSKSAAGVENSGRSTPSELLAMATATKSPDAERSGRPPAQAHAIGTEVAKSVSQSNMQGAATQLSAAATPAMSFGQSVRESAQARAESKADVAATESASRLVPKSPNAPTSMVQISLAAQANPPIVAREKPDILSLTVESLETAGTSETRGSVSSQTSLPTSVLQRTETPVMIARQMAEALQKASDRPVEIALSPKELGRVRMSISAAEVGITVNVVAERPETLDLMRRHIEQLAHEFAELGYTNMEFAFAQGETDQESYDEDASGSTEATVLSLDLEAETSASETPLSVTSGLDLRL